MKPDYIIGIDPGTQGGIAVIQNDHTLIKVWALSSLTRPAIVSVLEEITTNACHVFIEQVGVMPSDGIASAGKFMRSFGFLEGLIFANNIEPFYVLPQKWQQMMALAKVVGSRKAAHAKKATALFPKFAATCRQKRVTQEVCDALLIAEYGWRKTFM